MCTDDNKDTLIGFLYGELPDTEARAFEAHLKACETCRTDVAELRGVRDDLLAWAPPECRELPSSWTQAPVATVTPIARMRAWMPAFGLAAAAMLVLAVSAAIANVEIRYDANGLVVRTGRATTEQARAARTDAALQGSPVAQVTPGDLEALERRVMETFSAASPRVQTVALSSDNPQLSRDVRRLIEESERRTREEMAQRFLEILSDFEVRRRNDLLRVERAMGQMQTRTGAEIAQTRDAIGRLILASQGQDPR